MSEYKNFPFDFSERTLEILKGYKGKYEETLLLNCLLGLLVTPHEIKQFLKEIPNIKENGLKDLGIPVDSIEWGKTRRGNPRKKDLHSLIRCLRHSVTHLLVKPINSNGKIKGFHFTCEGNFDAPIECKQIRGLILEIFPHLNKAFRMERIEYAGDIEAIRAAKNEPTIPLEQVLRENNKVG